MIIFFFSVSKILYSIINVEYSDENMRMECENVCYIQHFCRCATFLAIRYLSVVTCKFSNGINLMVDSRIFEHEIFGVSHQQFFFVRSNSENHSGYEINIQLIKKDGVWWNSMKKRACQDIFYIVYMGYDRNTLFIRVCRSIPQP